MNVDGGWPKKRPLPPPSVGEAKGCLVLVAIVTLVLFVLLLVCGVLG